MRHNDGINKACPAPQALGSKIPDWNSPRQTVELNQGTKFQQELIDHQLKQEKARAEYLATLKK
jgi:hypothetical protein